MKPDNIVLTLNPLNVKIIDFNRSNLDCTSSLGYVKGTPGYFPIREDLRDGSKKWDVYALGAIILEANMKLDGYYDTKNEEETKAKAKSHLKEPKTCKVIAKIIERTLLI